MSDITPRTASDLSLLLDRLSGPDSEHWMTQFRRFVHTDDPWSTRFLILRPWRTVTIGKYKTPEEYLEAIKAAGRFVEQNYALPMVMNTPLCGVETEVELFKFSPEDALVDCRYYTEVIERMPKIGMTYCPPEVALALAAEKDSQGVYVAMEGVPSKDGKLGYFQVTWKDGGYVLDSGPIDPADGPAYRQIGVNAQVIFTEAKPAQD